MTTMLTAHLSLEDLTGTEAPGIANDFDEPEHYTNLVGMARILETLWSRIGPFDVVSGYRSRNVQAWLKTQTDQAATASFHSLGLAADIMPTTMQASEYFARILSAPDLRQSMGEIALKNTVLHLSAAVPPNKVNVPMVVENDVYRRIDEAEQKTFLDEYGLTVATGAGVIVAVAVGLIALMVLAKRRSRDRA